jgi:hypothetical protein
VQEQFTVLSRKASAFLGRGYQAFFLLFLRFCHQLARPQKGSMGGQTKSKASSLSSAEVGRLWEEPTEETGPKPGSVGILAL